MTTVQSNPVSDRAGPARTRLTPVVLQVLPSLETGGGGVLVPRDDAEALAKAVATLLDQPDALATLGRRGRAGVVEAFSWPRVAARTAEVYDAVLPRA